MFLLHVTSVTGAIQTWTFPSAFARALDDCLGGAAGDVADGKCDGGVVRRKVVWREQPDRRLFHVFNRRRRSVGVWAVESLARAELANHPGGRMLVLDEYLAKLPHLGHCKRLVVADVRDC
jgi:hypothetical protein